MNITIKEGAKVIQMASIATGVDVEDIKGGSQKPDAVNARAMVMWFYDHYGLTQKEIAERFGRSQRRVYSAIKNLVEREKFQSKLNADFKAFREGLKIEI